MLLLSSGLEHMSHPHLGRAAVYLPALPGIKRCTIFNGAHSTHMHMQATAPFQPAQAAQLRPPQDSLYFQHSQHPKQKPRPGACCLGITCGLATPSPPFLSHSLISFVFSTSSPGAAGPGHS